LNRKTQAVRHCDLSPVLVVLLHGKVGNMPSADGIPLRNEKLVALAYIAA